MKKVNSKTKEHIITAGNFISTFITTIIAVIAIALVIIKLLGWNVFSVDSSSMSPKYPVGSLIIVQNTEPEDIEVGDVITYVLNEDGTLVTHRVIAIDTTNKTFTTKGDANNSADSMPVLWGNMVGKVFMGIPLLGTPIRFITAEENRIKVIAAIAILLIISLVWGIFERRAEKANK